VRLLGSPVTGVDAGAHGVLRPDLVVTAAGDVPNIAWLAGSGVPLAGGVVVDDHCRVADGIVAAGDVTCVRRGAVTTRLPHWTSAVNQGRQAALTPLLGRGPALDDAPYFWTSQFGLDVKLSGLPGSGTPTIVDGDPGTDQLLLQWEHEDGSRSAASMNYRIPVVKLKRLGASASASPV